MKTRASVRKVSSLYSIHFGDSFNKNVDPLSEVKVFLSSCVMILLFLHLILAKRPRRN